tara:strand:- start:11140 stop:15390 length:4251 start_codon:yes stop_codon:yes gene_type:complete
MPRISQLNNIPASYDTDGGELIPVTINNGGTLQTFKIPASGLKGGEAYTLMTQMSSQYLSGHWVSRNTNDIVNTNSGNVGIGTNSPAAKLHLYGGHATTQMIMSAGNASNVELQLYNATSEWSMYSHNSSDSLRFYERGAGDRVTILAGGNVGIGTAAPDTKLQVTGGEVRVDNNYSFSSKNAAGNAINFLWIDGTNKIHVGSDTSRATGFVSINSDGKVGIGTGATSPSYKLDVTGDARCDGLAVSGAAPTLLLASSASGNTNLTFAQNNADMWSVRNDDVGAQVLSFYDHVNSSTRMVVTTGGSVGIGTTTPEQMLTVAGSISAYGSLYLRALGSNQHFQLEGGTNTLAVKDWDGTSIMTWNGSTNYVGIGISVPAYPLHIYANDYSYVHFTNSEDSTGFSVGVNDDLNCALVRYRENRPLTFWTNDLERVRIDNNGNVGLGTAAPDVNVSVVGCLSASESLSARHVSVNGVADVTSRVKIDSTGRHKNFELYDSTVRAGYVGYDNTDNITRVFATSASSQLALGTADTEAVRVDASGNVGIGITSPIAPLHIEDPTNDGDPLVVLQKGSELYSMTKNATTGNLAFSGNTVGMGYDFYDEHDGIIMSLQKGTSGAVAIGCVPDHAHSLTVNGTISGKQVILGRAQYINFNTETGESGYGIRDNGGTIEAKNEGGTWMTVLTSSGGGGGGGSGTINSGVAKKLAFYSSTGTTVDDATDLYVGSSGTYFSVGGDSFGQATATVKGTLSSSGNVTANGSITLGETHTSSAINHTISQTSNDLKFTHNHSSGHNIIFANEASGAESMRISDGGHIGIGRTPSSYPLEIESNANGSILLNGDATNDPVIFIGSDTGVTKGSIQFSNTGADVVLMGTDGKLSIATASGGPGTNVGIGTTDPAHALHIQSHSNAVLALSGTYPAVHFYDYNSADNDTRDYTFIRGAGTGGGDPQIQLGWYDQSAAAAHYQMTFLTAGYVGIGTTTPSKALHVKSSDGDQIVVERTSVGSAEIGIDNITGTADLVLDPQTNSSGVVLRYHTGGSSYNGMVLDESGYVGIGTTTPTSTQGWIPKLNVEHAGDVAIILKDTNTAQQNAVGTTGAGLFLDACGHATASSNNIIVFRTENTDAQFSPTERMRITEVGRVGIGTSSPTQLLEIDGGSETSTVSVLDSTGRYKYQEFHHSDTRKAYVGYDNTDNVVRLFGTAAASEIAFGVADTEHMRLDTNGNLGLGTSSPSVNFHIASASSPVFVIEDTTNNVKVRTAVDNSRGYFGTISNHSLELQINAATQGILTTTGLGLGNLAPEAKLHVTGSGYFTEDVVASYGSDERLKDNITRITGALDKVDRLGGYTFTWNDKANPLLIKHHYNDAGVIAQEVEDVMPEAVVTRDDGYMGVRYERLVPLLIESIKELKAEIEELKKNR